MTEAQSRRTISRRSLLIAAVTLAAGGTAGVLDLTLGSGGKKVFKTRFMKTILKPAQVLDLSTWKIGLPTATEISNPHLESFSDANFRSVQAVQFTAHCGDKAQAGSKYARSELREMNADGTNASWSSTSGTHTMSLTQRITHLPVVKPQVVCGQIHNDNYLILVTLSGKILTVRYINDTVGTLDRDYQLGATFDMKIVASGGFVDVFYNGLQKVHQPMRQDGCYFKAGCYVQSNTQTGDAPTAYGQVEILALDVSHE